MASLVYCHCPLSLRTSAIYSKWIAPIHFRWCFFLGISRMGRGNATAAKTDEEALNRWRGKTVAPRNKYKRVSNSSAFFFLHPQEYSG